MTEAVTVRRDGDTFQARMFWLRAAHLLLADSPLIRVGFEVGPKSYDDIWVDYAPERGQRNQFGSTLLREHIQCKWHVAPGSYGYAQLANPEFINANARSLLQRAFAAWQASSGHKDSIRFKLLTNWSVDRNDPLRAMIQTRSGTLRPKRLFDETTDGSRAGGIRKLWREHLGLDDSGLQAFATSLAFSQASDTFDEIRYQLDLAFRGAGMRCIPHSDSAFPYDDLIFQWMAQGRQEFDRGSLHDALRRERLLADTPAPTITFGVKSFEHALDPLELRCNKVLDLTPDFDDRFVRDASDWDTTLYPRLSTFLRDAAQGVNTMRLAMDAHATLAFAAGSVLDIKSGRAIELEQRSPNRRVWAADDENPQENWPNLVTELRDIGQGAEIAIAAGFTHNIGKDVADFVADRLPEVGRLLICGPSGGQSHQSVRCGRHATQLAASLVSALRSTAPAPQVHLFLAVPNALAFFLGQRRPQLGQLTLYEFDFEGTQDRTYRPSLSLPVSLKPAI